VRSLPEELAAELAARTLAPPDELAAAALSDLLAQVVFVGGATVELWITDPGAPPVRPTQDVDVIVEVTTRLAFHEFEARLRERRFIEDQESGVICRRRHDPSGLILDAMPARAEILGFENRWQAEALPHAVERELPSGVTIRAVSPPYLLATKLEAFKGRGRSDFLGSRDFADIVALLDGRAELAAGVATAPGDVRRYISEEIRRLLDSPRLLDGLAGTMRPDPPSQQRVDDVVLPALRPIAGQAQRP
jgi:nucleotidyltransferase AbiEii toxin of type IV toxin-antitoxin system